MSRHRENQMAYETKGKELDVDFPKIPDANLRITLAKWMRDMKLWGQEVRDDIIRLEAAVGVATGDPGDPPPAPRGKT